MILIGKEDQDDDQYSNDEFDNQEDPEAIQGKERFEAKKANM